MYIQVTDPLVPPEIVEQSLKLKWVQLVYKKKSSLCSLHYLPGLEFINQPL